MTEMERIAKLQVPNGPIDIVLDTDTYNEIDDQYAIAYLLKSRESWNVKAIYAAPFFNQHSESPADGMEKSYQEVLNLLRLMGREGQMPVLRGSEQYLPDEQTPVESSAARHLCELAMTYSTDKPLYVIAIGAITNVASAVLMNPEIVERIVVIWLGGHAVHWPCNDEFNLRQDIAAARVIFGCGVPFVQLPCNGVVSSFHLSEADILRWLKGKNPLCDYLVQHTIDEVDYAIGKPWSRVIWDVTAVAWLKGKFMEDMLMASPIPEYDCHYGIDSTRHLMRYVYHIHHDALVEDLFNTLILP